VRSRYRALLIFVLALGLAGVLAAGANARTKPKPKLAPMLADRSCKALFTLSDFPGAESETSLGGALHSGERSTTSSSYLTTCQFAAPPPSEGNPTPEGGGGLDELAVFDRFLYERNHNLSGLFPWLPQIPKHTVTITFASHAYIGYDEGIGYGLEQVRNDVVYFYTESTNVLGMLGIAASELCIHCKR